MSFVVETTLAGDADQIKESMIAIEVYGRRPDYNPQIDSTVRVEAGRLRARLRQYYENGGRAEEFEIELPKGTYAPVFRHKAATDAASPVLVEAPVAAPPQKRFRWAYVVAVALLIAAGISATFVGSGSQGSERVDSVGVLPFVSLSGNASTERFCAGLTEDVTTGLTRIDRLRVSARATMARYRDKAIDFGSIGREHGVTAVLEGSVRQSGERVVVTTQLIDTRNGFHLWAERYDRNAGDPVALQHEISARIVSELSRVIQGDVSARQAERETEPQTLELYHRAQELLRIPVMKDGVPESVPSTVVDAVRTFEEVTQRDPRFAKAWAGLAEAAEWEYELRGNQPRERLEMAKAAARRAVELQPDLAEAWKVLTSILFYRAWDIPGAEAACRRAIELNPRDTVSRQRYVDLLRIQGRSAEARFEIDRAIKLQPVAAGLRVKKAYMLYEQGECSAALAEAKAAAGLTNQMPVYPMTLWVQGLCLEQRLEYSAAEKLFRAALAYQPHDPWNEPALGHLLARTGRIPEAEKILTELRDQLAHGRMTHMALSLVLTALGRHGEAIASLERGWKERDDAVLFIGVDPRFRPLQSEPRFRDLVARLRSPSL